VNRGGVPAEIALGLLRLTVSFRLVYIDSAQHIAAELLALTKMNWNTSQLDSRLPITVRTRRSDA
jgi:hypothetical protein